MDLYESLPNGYDKMPVLDYYKAEKKYTDCVFVIFPGGGYDHLAEHEGAGYAKLFNTWGADAFVLRYSVFPNVFPAQLNDARRAIQYVRHNAKEYGINPDKIVVVGSSAGGHLASLVCNYKKQIEPYEKDEISCESFFPNYQVLCYSVTDAVLHKGCILTLLGENNEGLTLESVSANIIADETAPPAFIWHNQDDKAVHISNSLDYAKRLTDVGVPAEIHIFPFGGHGVGMAKNLHSGEWTNLLFKWLCEMNIY